MGRVYAAVAASRRLALGLVVAVLLFVSALGLVTARGAGRPHATGASPTASGEMRTTFQVAPSETTAEQGTPPPAAAGVTSPARATPMPSGRTPRTVNPTITPQPAPYDAMAVGPTTPVTIAASAALSIYVDVANIGANPWVAGWIIRLACESGCIGINNLYPGVDLAPGQQTRYTLQLYQPYPQSVGTYEMHYSMEYNGVPFGHDIHLRLIVIIAPPLFTEQAPSCDTPPGVNWLWHDAAGGNTMVCSATALLMQQSSSLIPEAALTGIPSPYDPNYFNAQVHVHFATPLASTYAGFDFHEHGTDTECDRIQFDINPAGNARVIEYITNTTTGGCNSDTWSTNSPGPAQDYDLTIVAEPGGAFLKVNGSNIFIGGLEGTGGVTGLSVRDDSGTSSQVQYSSFELDNPKVTQTSTFMVIHDLPPMP